MAGCERSRRPLWASSWSCRFGCRTAGRRSAPRGRTPRGGGRSATAPSAHAGSSTSASAHACPPRRAIRSPAADPVRWSCGSGESDDSPLENSFGQRRGSATLAPADVKGDVVRSKLRQHLTYANVMATIAVFIALGGSSYAALSLTGRDIKDRSLTQRDLKRNTLGGSRIKESRLGKVRRARNADRLNGVRASRLLVRC